MEVRRGKTINKDLEGEIGGNLAVLGAGGSERVVLFISRKREVMKVQKSKDGIIFQVKVQPKASRNELAGLYQDALKIRLTAPPVEGKANKALIDFLADWLGVKKSQVEIVSGQLSKIKIIKVMGKGSSLIEKIQKLISSMK